MWSPRIAGVGAVIPYRWNRCLEICAGDAGCPYASHDATGADAVRPLNSECQACGGARALKMEWRNGVDPKSVLAQCRVPVTTSGTGNSGVAGGTRVPASAMVVQTPQ